MGVICGYWLQWMIKILTVEMYSQGQICTRTWNLACHEFCLLVRFGPKCMTNSIFKKIKFCQQIVFLYYLLGSNQSKIKLTYSLMKSKTCHPRNQIKLLQARRRALKTPRDTTPPMKRWFVLQIFHDDFYTSCNGYEDFSPCDDYVIKTIWSLF